MHYYQYLLKNLWTYLPLFWHANYDAREYIYVPKQLQALYDRKVEEADLPVKFVECLKGNTYPKIQVWGSGYAVTACYWSDFEGLMGEEILISMDEENRVCFGWSTKICYHVYHCGICY